MGSVGARYRHKAEACVSNLSVMVEEVEIKKRELKEIAHNDGVTTINWDRIGSVKSISDLTGRTALKNIEIYEVLYNEIVNMERMIAKVLEVISELQDIERAIIKLRYFEHKDWQFIATQVGYSVSNCHRIKANGIDSIAKALYGLKALEDLSFMDILL